MVVIFAGWAFLIASWCVDGRAARVDLGIAAVFLLCIGLGWQTRRLVEDVRDFLERWSS